jgi:Arc/MetJ-type ribon-helix-helix transcriptional regulator
MELMARPKTMAGRKIVSLPPDLEKAVDDFRFENRFPTESEAIRHLIELGLKAAKAEHRKPT